MVRMIINWYVVWILFLSSLIQSIKHVVLGLMAVVSKNCMKYLEFLL